MDNLREGGTTVWWRKQQYCSIALGVAPFACQFPLQSADLRLFKIAGGCRDLRFTGNAATRCQVASASDILALRDLLYSPGPRGISVQVGVEYAIGRTVTWFFYGVAQLARGGYRIEEPCSPLVFGVQSSISSVGSLVSDRDARAAVAHSHACRARQFE